MKTQGLIFLFNLALAQAQGDNKTPRLDPDVIQAGSFTDGSGSLGADAAQAASSTSENNFINFCKGKTLTNGLQITEGSCNGIGA
jgi:predicted outer membrane protein